jgi:competence protein ComGC
LKKRESSGLSLIELLISIVIISTILVPILNFYNAAIRNTSATQQKTKLKFLAEEEMEKYISLEYNDQSLQAFASSGGRINFYEHGDYLVKSHIVLIDPETGEIPDLYPTQARDDTFLKRVTISVARKDKLGGQVDVIYLKSP